jgi:hypothetical protein
MTRRKVSKKRFKIPIVVGVLVPEGRLHSKKTARSAIKTLRLGSKEVICVPLEVRRRDLKNLATCLKLVDILVVGRW